MEALPVRIDGVWQSAHPTRENMSLPRAMDDAPPGVSDDGRGGARKRMKNANFSIPPMALTGSGEAVSLTSFGWVANWHASDSSRSVGKSSLLIPISTL